MRVCIFCWNSLLKIYPRNRLAARVRFVVISALSFADMTSNDLSAKRHLMVGDLVAKTDIELKIIWVDTELIDLPDGFRGLR